MNLRNEKLIASKVDNEAAFKYHRDILPKFASIYDPILESGLFSYVGYFRLYRNNQYFMPLPNSKSSLCKKDPLFLMKHYIESIPDNGNYYADKVRRVKNKFISPWNSSFDKKDTIISLFMHFQITEGITVYKRRTDYVEGIYIVPKGLQTDFNNFALQNSSFFHEILSNISEKSLIVAPENKCRRAKYKNTVDISLYPEELILQEKLEVLVSKLQEDHFTNLGTNLKHEISLTSRQIQVILASIHGETSKEAAKKLSIGYRTVETHWNAIQRKFLEKTGLFYSRAQIIETFLENAERYLNTPGSSTLIYDIQNYRNSLKILQTKKIYQK